MKKILIALIFCILSINAFSADTKITDLGADAAPDTTDLLTTVDDVGGTPVNKKATIANVLSDTNIPDDLTITSTKALVATTVDTGQGATEVYAMDQDVQTTDTVTFATVDTGQGANELYDMDQNVLQASAVTFATVDTGQGANELYDMDQNVLTTSSPTFSAITLTNPLTVPNGGSGAATFTDGGLLLGSGVGAFSVMGVLADGSIVIGDGVTDPTTLAAFTASTGQLKHESGGIEADISAIADGGMLVGTGAGTMAIRASFLTGGAAGFITHELGGVEADVSGFSGVIGISGGTTLDVDTFAELDTAIADKALVNKADGAVWSGVHDFGGATSLEIPNGANPTVNVEGEIAIDSTTGQLVYFSSGQVRISHEVDYKCGVIENLAAADDNKELWMSNDACEVISVGVHCAGTCTTGADISLEDRSGNAMTHTTPTHSTGSNNTTFQTVSAANALVAGEAVRFDVDNSVDPETDDYTICIGVKYNRQ